MLKLIRKIVGNWTLPKNAEQSEYGDWWIEVYGMPTGEIKFSTLYGFREVRDYTYPYNYQKLEQNYFGVWKPVTTWIGRHHQLEYYRLMHLVEKGC